MFFSPTPFAPPRIPLRFSEDGRFRILMLSDIHGGVGYNRKKTVAAIRALVSSCLPDLVVFDGDTAGPGVIHISSADELKSLLTDLSAPMEERGIPWCHTFGNHDDNYGLPNEEAEAVYESFPRCVSRAGPEELSGTGNYVLPVTGPEGGDPLLAVWCLDSHSGMKEFLARWGLDADTRILQPDAGDRGCYDSVNMDQVLWYYASSKAAELAYGKKIPGVMFFHIPLPEFDLMTKYRSETHFRGIQWEDVASTPLYPGLFRACAERGDVKGIFCGHDHENDFDGIYMGIRMACDASLSYHACQINELRGGRVIDFGAADPAAFTTRTVKIADIMGHEGDSDE